MKNFVYEKLSQKYRSPDIENGIKKISQDKALTDIYFNYYMLNQIAEES